MALEVASFVYDLNAANPAASDFISEADDHMRLIKTAVKNTFPGGNHALAVGIAFSAVGSVATTVPNETTTLITFGTEEYDTHSAFASNAFVAPMSGIYHFDASVTFATDAFSGTGPSQIGLFVNGTEARRGDFYYNDTGDEHHALVLSTDLQLDAADSVTVRIWHQYGEDLVTTPTSCYFNGHGVA